MAKRITMKNANHITFEKLYKEYLDDCRARNLRPNTIIHYEEAYTTLSHYIDPKTDISKINKSSINKLVVELQDGNRNDVTVFSYARDMKTLLNFAMKQDYIAKFKVELPKVSQSNIEPYTDEELMILLKKPDMKKCSFVQYRSWVIINFLLSTGVRLSSFINIKIKDVNLSDRVVNITHTKNRQCLIIPLNKAIVRILQEYLRVRNADSDDDYLFCTVEGKQLTKSSTTMSLRDYNQSRDVKTGIHRYRHTFAKKWIKAGGSVVTLQKILGHSSLTITQNYINLMISDMQEEIDEINILSSFTTKRIKMK